MSHHRAAVPLLILIITGATAATGRLAHATTPVAGPVIAPVAAPVNAPVVDAHAAAELQLERGRRLYETGVDLPGARAALDEAIRLRPELGAAYLYRALVTIEGHPLAAARADFEFALRLAETADGHRHFAEALAGGGEPDAALTHYLRALELAPDHIDTLYLLAKLRRARGERAAAIALLERHATLAPKGTAHHVLAEIFIEAGDDARALIELELDLATDVTCYESRLNLAAIHAGRGAHAKARDEYERSLLHHPADARALGGLGKAYLALKDYEFAVASLRRANDLSPDDREVSNQLLEARDRLRKSLAGNALAAATQERRILMGVAGLSIGFALLLWATRGKRAA